MQVNRSHEQRRLSRRDILRVSATAGLASLTGLGSGASLHAATNEPSADRRPAKIMVAFSWSFKNIGDIAITPGIFHLLREHVPGAQVTLP